MTSVIITAGSYASLVQSLNQYFYHEPDGPSWSIDMATGAISRPDGSTKQETRAFMKGNRYWIELTES